MLKIGILTSGGDSPGMNAAVRAAYHTLKISGCEAYGVKYGFRGLYENEISKISESDVRDIIGRGGTILKSARFPEFKEIQVREKAVENLKAHNIQGLIIIGGDGSYQGALKLTEMGYPCIGIPGTIDNDAPGTDLTIGFDTAMRTIINAIQNLRDTSFSHCRCAIIEVMGRDAGDLALWSGVATGAEYIIIPEVECDYNHLEDKIKTLKANGQEDFVIVIAEGAKGSADKVKQIMEKLDIESRLTVLGHIQRGGSPTGQDRIIATLMATKAAKLIQDGKGGLCIGVKNSEVVTTDITEALNTKHEITKKMKDALDDKLAY